MSILDQVTQMKSQGAQDSEIIQHLQNQGIPPREIQDALGQASIKSAVDGSQISGMQQSIMNSPQEDYSEQENYPQQNNYSQNYAAAPAPTYDSQIPQQSYAPQMPPANTYQEYPQQEYNQDYSQDYYAQNQSVGGYEYAQPSDSGTLVEIAEQVFTEKVRKIQRQLDKLNEFRTLSETRLSNIEVRLKRMEEMFDKLQLSILDKVGSFGKNVSNIQKEMDMMQDSFSKVAGPLLDKKGRR